jgi:hypothetical protein
MTESQKLFVSLEKQKDEVKKYFEKLNESIAAVQAEIGINGMFQDEEGTVYKIVVPDGKFVHFDHVSYVRTRRVDEKRGDLSIKDAEAAGYNVPTK